MPPQLVGGTIWTRMVPQEETLPCLRGLDMDLCRDRQLLLCRRSPSGHQETARPQPCLHSEIRPAPLKSFVPTERFLFEPRRVEERLGLSAEVGKAPAPTEGGTQGASQDLICLQYQIDGLALASDYLQLRWMFTGTQPEFASLHFIPERTCFPHFIFGEDTSNCGHMQKRLPAPFDVS
ncbi:dexamethasone-induced protein isoform X1 [Gorilla gorilla gorilla]|uniref:dexamethasone-induced protein isoform X1 n=1 Tax=Gorilla gorilla gorilla TaxID=9595 RepID=UPI002446229C|nr:dexamethasone-induced protein isoform X1 [Gorilla gorilla gorilla]